MMSIEVHVRRAGSASVALGLTRSDLLTFDDRAIERRAFFIGKYPSIRKWLDGIYDRTPGRVMYNMHISRFMLIGVQRWVVEDFIGFAKTIVPRVDIVELTTNTSKESRLSDWAIDAEMRRDEALIGKKFSDVSEWAVGCRDAAEKYPTISYDPVAFHQHLRSLGITPPPTPTGI